MEGLISTGSPAMILTHSLAWTLTMGLVSTAVSTGAVRLEVMSARLMSVVLSGGGERVSGRNG